MTCIKVKGAEQKAEIRRTCGLSLARLNAPGYRRLGIDYESNGLDFNVVMQAPMFGLVFRF